MNNENEFNFSNENSFRKSKIKSSGSGFGKTVVLPFISGILGATLVIGTCFGVPSIKNKLLNNQHGIITTPTSSVITSDSQASKISITDYSDTSVAVAESVLPSVVGITITYQIDSIFGTSTTSNATGSGIIISEDGYIVTNNHVISSESSSSFYVIEKATGIKINLYNDTETYDATVVGTDAYTDLAVLKIEKTGLTPAVLGNSNDVKVGEFVMAVGNPLGMEYSVTSGIVSAIDREVESDGSTYTAIQTDAAINSGNSGGALVNKNGEVIGINTLKLAGTGIEGIGFAIPISSTTSVINQLIEYQTVKRPYIGILGSSVDSSVAKKYNIPEGIYVESVEKDSPAEKAELKVGDIITKIEGKAVTSVNELNKIKYTYNIGDTVKLTVHRDNQEIEITILLAETPEEPEEAQTQATPEQEQQQYNTSPNDIFSIFDIFR